MKCNYLPSWQRLFATSLAKLKPLPSQQNFKKSIAIILFYVSTVANAQLVTYPQLASLQGCQYAYTVKAKANGTSTWSTLALYNVQATNQSSTPVNTTVTNFDCSGAVDIEITFNTTVTSANIRPNSIGITPTINGTKITFTIPGPKKFYVDINDNHYANCIHFIAQPIEVNPPQPGDPNVVYIPTGTFDKTIKTLTDGQTLYVQGGAAVSGIVLGNNTKVLGRGFIYRASSDAITANVVTNAYVEGMIDMNHGWSGNGGNGFRSGQCTNLTIKNCVSFSSKKWGDGYNIFSSKNVTIDNAFIRTNDDAITFYGGGKSGFTGDCKNITVTNSVLLNDLAQPFHIGVYGDQNMDTEIRDITCSNIDIDDWGRTTGRPVIYFTVGDRVRAANHRFENIRVTGYMASSFTKSLIGMAIVKNATYNFNPGRQIDSIYYMNVTYTQAGYTPGSSISGYDATRIIKNVFFQGLKINDTTITNASQGNITIGSNTQNITFSSAVSQIPLITSATSLSVNIGSTFSYTISATNSPTSYSAAGLPAGLSVNTSTGVISGTPTSLGTSTVTITATNATGTGSRKLSIVVASLKPVITSAATANDTINTSFTYAIKASSSPTSYNATGLPTGLSVNTTTGVISGTPTATGTSSITISATNGYGTGSTTLTLTIIGNLTIGATYAVKVEHSGMVAGVSESSTANGATVVQGTNNSTANQQWVVEDAGGGYYKFKNKNSGKYMDVSGGSTADGATLIQWPAANGLNQQFQLSTMGDYYTIKARNSGKCIEVQGASTTDGTKLQQLTCNGATNQNWQFVPGSTSARMPVGDENGQPIILTHSGAYPNPVKNILNIKLSDSTESVVEVYDEKAKLIGHYRIENNGTIDLSELPTGLYCVKFKDGKQLISRKIIKE